MDDRTLVQRIDWTRCADNRKHKKLCAIDACRAKGTFETEERIYWNEVEIFACPPHRRLLRDLEPKPAKLRIERKVPT